MEQVKEHWLLNPGICFSLIETMSQYLDDFQHLFPEKTIVAATNGNNLFSHPMDIVVRTQDGRQDCFNGHQPNDGNRTCFVLWQDGRVGIETLQIQKGSKLYPPNLLHAIYGKQTVQHANPVDLAAKGLYRSFYGNYTHLFRLPLFILPEQGYSVSVEAVEKCGAFLGEHQMVLDPSLAESAIKGQPVTFTLPRYLTKRRFIKPGENCPIVSAAQIQAARESGTQILGILETIQLTPEIIYAALLRSGYDKNDFELDMSSRQISIRRILRSRGPLTMLGIAENGSAIAATFDGVPFTAGPTIEEAASIMAAMGVNEALAIGNGSEVAMYSDSHHTLVNTRASSRGKGGSGNELADAATVTAIVYYV
jgi:hypothetical protein